MVSKGASNVFEHAAAMAELAKFFIPLIVADCFLLEEEDNDDEDEDASNVACCDEWDLDDRRDNGTVEAFDSTTVARVKIPTRQHNRGINRCTIFFIVLV